MKLQDEKLYRELFEMGQYINLILRGYFPQTEREEHDREVRAYGWSYKKRELETEDLSKLMGLLMSFKAYTERVIEKIDPEIEYLDKKLHGKAELP